MMVSLNGLHTKSNFLRFYGFSCNQHLIGLLDDALWITFKGFPGDRERDALLGIKTLPSFEVVIRAA